MIQHIQNAQISQKQDGHNIYVIMKTMCHPGCHHNGFVATYALGHMMYGYTLLAPMNQTVLNKLSKENNIKSIYIYIYIYIYIVLSKLFYISSQFGKHYIQRLIFIIITFVTNKVFTTVFT